MSASREASGSIFRTERSEDAEAHKERDDGRDDPGCRLLSKCKSGGKGNGMGSHYKYCLV